MSTPLRPRITAAFFLQAAISFAVALAVTLIGIAYLSLVALLVVGMDATHLVRTFSDA